MTAGVLSLVCSDINTYGIFMLYSHIRTYMYNYVHTYIGATFILTKSFTVVKMPSM